MRHLKILEFALAALARRRGKTLAIGAVFSLLVAVLASVLFLTGSLQRQARELLDQAPALVVQRTSMGRHDLIPREYAGRIAALPGVIQVTPRLWGYYFDSLTSSNYTVMAAQEGLPPLALLEGRLPRGPGECALGPGVAAARGVGPGEDLILIDSRNVGQVFEVVGVFRPASSLLTHDLVVLGAEDFVAFFGVPPGQATDLAVEVRNPLEVGTVARKIKQAAPDTRPLARSELQRTYEAAFHWRSGMVLAAFSAALLSFGILAWDRATGLSAEERQEIAVLKATGWDTADVLELKAWEGLAVSVASFLAGLALAYLHVFHGRAGLLRPLLVGWSVLFPPLKPTPFVDVYQVASLALLTVVPYLIATVVPSWRAASADPETFLRG